MIDQIIIGDKASFDDFGASVAKRARKQPPKKSIKETVPFSNVTYDFTKINGEIYWEEGEHEYVFEMTAPTAEQLEEMKTALSGWLMNIIQEELHDPLIPDYHFIVTYEDMSFEDDEGMDKTTATAVFSAYPYKIANYPKVYEVDMSAGETITFTIINESSHKITPVVTTSGAIALKINDVNSAGMGEGTYTIYNPKLEIGENEIEIECTPATDVHFSLSYYEEVF